MAWDGGEWSPPIQIMTANSGDLKSVSCPSVSFCMAVGTNSYNDGVAFEWNGSTWSSETVPSSASLLSVSCPTASFCVAVSNVNSGNVLIYNGSTWSSETVPSTPNLFSVSCPTASFCMAVGGSGNAFTYNGTSWTAESLPSGVSGLNAVSCPTVSFCVAVDANGNALTYNGTSWSAPQSIDPNAGINSVSCPTASFCMAIGVSSSLTWNGTSWSAPQSFSQSFGPNSVSCATASFCVAAAGEYGANGNGAFVWNGSAWSNTGTNLSGLSSVSCSTASFCMATDGSGFLTYNGFSWSVPELVDPNVYFTSVSCPTAGFCAAVGQGNGAICPDGGGVGVAAVWNGSSWSTPTTFCNSLGLFSVSCPTVSFCMAVGGGQTSSSGYVFSSYNGASWSKPQVVDPSATAIYSVSCPTASFCMAVGDTGTSGTGGPTGPGTAITWNGSSWSAPQSIGNSTYGLGRVSCPTASFCIAAGDGGNVFTYNGASWSAPSQALGYGAFLSCPTARSCAEVSLGYASTYNGASWSAPEDIDHNGGLRGLSCPTASFCVAVGQSGNVVIGRGSGTGGSGGSGGSGTVPTLNYVALGDSYSSGEGNAPFDLSSSVASDPSQCHQSPLAYPVDLVGDVSSSYNLKLFMAACTGAQTNDVTSTWQFPGQQPPYQQPQLDYLHSSTNLVTMTMGGDNVGFAPVVKLCLATPDHCVQKLRTMASSFGGGHTVVTEDISALFGELTSLYAKVKIAAPNAAIYVLGYPNIFPSTASGCPSDGLGFILSPNFAWFRTETARLDQVIQAAAAEAGVNYVPDLHAFSGHELCSSSPYVNGVNLTGSSLENLATDFEYGLLHPNADGHQQLASLLASAITASGSTLANPAPESGVSDPLPNYGPMVSISAPSVLQMIAGVLGYYGQQAVHSLSATASGAAEATVPVVAQCGWAPSTALFGVCAAFASGAKVTASLFSTPTSLGTVTANAQGEVDTTFSIPSGVPAGLHTLVLSGPSASGATVSAIEPIVLASGIPGPPGAPQATVSGTSVKLSWSPPPSGGGSAPTSFTIYPFSSGLPGTPITVTATTTSYTFTSLTAGVPYDFSVAATNANGTGQLSAPSAKVIPTSSDAFSPLPPTRICDTRPGNPSGLSGTALTQCEGKTISAGSTLDVQMAGIGGVPTGSPGVLVNMTAVGATSPTYLTVYPAGTPRPTASSLNPSSASPVANLIEVSLPTSGADAGIASIYNDSGSTNVIVDVEGYLAPGSAATSSSTTFVPLGSPERIADTRCNSASYKGAHGSYCAALPPANASAAPLRVGGTGSFQVAGLSGVPSSAKAVVLNLTATDTSGNGYFTAWPAGLSRPTASNLNFIAGSTVANQVIVPVGGGGSIDVFSSAGADVVIDVAGYFTAEPATGAAGMLSPAAPLRICDTRPGNPSQLFGQAAQCEAKTLPPGGTLEVQVAGVGGIPPTGISAVVVNLTATNPSAPGYLSVDPSSLPPSTSNVNWSEAGKATANFVIAPVSAAGTITIYNFAGSTDVIVDVVGWYG